MKKYLYASLVGVAGVGILYFMLWQMRLGDFAESPQRLLVNQNLNRIVAGGKAGLLFEGKDTRDRARLLIRCKSTAEIVVLKEGEESRRICDVYVRLEELRGVGEAVVQVRWDG